MAEFDYSAVSHDEFKNGRINADSEGDAETLLSEAGLTVISIKRHSVFNFGPLDKLFSRLNSLFENTMSTSEKILFTSQLGSMIKAGLPLIEALTAFIDQKNSSGSTVIIGKVIQELQSGVKLSEALGQFPKIFSPQYLAVIRSGENSGTLAESLNYLSVQLRKEYDLNGKVKSALIYPTVVITAMVAVMIFISVSVIPKIVVFAQSSGQKLPAYTLAMVSFVNFMTKYWYLLIAAIIGLIILLVLFAQSQTGKKVLGRLLLKLPLIGDLTARYNQARFARVLGGFYIYGVNIVTSFDILGASLGNSVYKESCERIKTRLTMGQSLAQAIGEERQIYPSIMIRLIKGAEKTGELGSTLDKLAAYYEEELEVALRNVLALIEPIMIFILGFGVLGLAMAVVVPIYKVTSTLK